jgi:hypothetical protein
MHPGPASKGGSFDANDKCLSYKPDDVRTWEDGGIPDWQIPVHEILHHVMVCEKECPELGMTLDQLFARVSAYQQQAA